MDWTRKAGLPLLFLLAAVAGPTPASAADATLYELVESMSIVQHDGRAYRQAWAAIDGTARPGTLLCPFQVTCTLVGWGWSNVETITGKGTFSGSFTVVVDGDNAVDGPEASVLVQLSGIGKVWPIARTSWPASRTGPSSARRLSVPVPLRSGARFSCPSSFRGTRPTPRTTWV